MWTILTFFLFLFYILGLSVQEPISLAAVASGVAASSALTGFLVKKGYCYMRECCTNRWTSFNVSSLQKGLEHDVFGQHIAIEVVFKSINEHVTNNDPKKALVLSFHGWRGTGKNHVSDIVAKHLYKKGLDSKYVHKIIASHVFTDNALVSNYKHNLKLRIIGAVKACERSLFIFDEIEKMPAGIIDVIKPFIDYHQSIDGVNFRKSIFLLLGNVAAKDINKHVLNHLVLGKKREQLTVKETHYILSTLSLNRYGGLEGAAIVESDLIDWFVPFLPLERKHVRMCAELQLKALGYTHVTNSLLDEIADEIEYVPEETQLLSSSGCKRVDSIIKLKNL